MPDSISSGGGFSFNKVRIPVVPVPLPTPAELRIKHPPYGSIFDALAENCNSLMGYRFLHSIPIIAAPWKWNYRGGVRTGAPNDGDTAQTRYVRFRSSPLAQVLFVAMGYSAVRTGVVGGQRQSLGTFAVEVRAVPIAPTATTPGSGDMVDPGVEFRSIDGNLPNPVRNNEYVGSGLKWIYTPLAEPPAVSVDDPQTRFPRLLRIPAGTALEVAVSWESVSVNSILVSEAYRPEV